MDPEAAIRELAVCINEKDYGAAVYVLHEYYRWRLAGGCMPLNGDERASGLATRLADALENVT